MLSKIVKDFFGHTFLVDTNVKNAQVTYIDDPYDRKKDIKCTTPGKITIPWDPCRIQAKKNKILVEKEGYVPKVVEFKINKIILFKVMPLAGIMGMLAAILHLNFHVPLHYILVAYVILACKLSLGSEDLYVDLEPINER